MNGGPGNDHLNGGTGNDIINGGTGNDVINGGGGNDNITGGQGIDTLVGGPGSDTFVWLNGDGVDATIDGGSDGGDTLKVTLTNSADTVQFDPAASGNGFSVGLSGTTLNAVNMEGADIDVSGASDAVTVNHLGGSALTNITLRLGADAATDSVTVNGSNSTDAYTMSVSSGIVNISRSGGASINNQQADAGNGGEAITLNLNGGADSLTVQQTLAGTTTTVNAGAGNDTISVSPNGNADGIAGLLIVNGDANSDKIGRAS